MESGSDNKTKAKGPEAPEKGRQGPTPSPDDGEVERQGAADKPREAARRPGQRKPKAAPLAADSDSGARFRSQPDELLQVRGLRYAHPGGEPIFRDLDFAVHQGETVVIMGGSGVGKTTLSNLVFALQPKSGAEREGVIKMDRSRAALVLQEGAVFEHLNVGGNLALVLRRRKQRPVPERLKEMLHQVRLDPKSLTQSPDTLSGGEKRRLALARALAASPELLYCDEPSAGLDRDNVVEMGKLFRSLVRRTLKAAVIVTHDPMLAALTADRVLLMEQGHLVPLVEWPDSPDQLSDSTIDERHRQIAELTTGRLSVRKPLPERAPATGGDTRKTDRMKTLIQESLLAPGDYALNALRALAALPGSLRHLRDFAIVFWKSFSLSGTSGLPFFALVGAILGATFIMVLLGASILPARVTLEKVQAVPLTAMAPPLMGFLFAARSGSAVASWLGSMSYTRQVDALRTLEISPEQYLRAPVWLSMVLAFLMTGAAFFTAMWAGAWLMCKFKVGIAHPAAVLHPFVNKQIAFHSAVKGPLYALITASVTTHVGLTAKSTSEEVARGITRVIIICTVLTVLVELYFAGLIIAGNEA